MTRIAVKHALLRVARAAGLLELSRRLTSHGILIMGYHFVSIDDEHLRFPSIFFSRETFRRRLEAVARRYRVISLREAVEQIRSGRTQRHQIVLTFDDGLYNFAASAAPVLRQFDLPATVYLVSEPMLSQQPAFPLLIHDIVLRTGLTRAPRSLSQVAPSTSLVSTRDRDVVAGIMLEQLRALPLDTNDRIEFARRLARSLEVDIDEILERRIWHYLSSDEIIELSRAGFDVQVHGHTHRNVVENIDVTEEETRTCREVIEKTLGRAATDYCYPSGFWHEAAWPHLERAGMRSATTTLNGPNFGKTPLLALRRYMDAENRTLDEFLLDTSNLRWLLHVLRKPSRLYAPSEKLRRFVETGVGF